MLLTGVDGRRIAISDEEICANELNHHRHSRMTPPLLDPSMFTPNCNGMVESELRGRQRELEGTAELRAAREQSPEDRRLRLLNRIGGAIHELRSGRSARSNGH